MLVSPSVSVFWKEVVHLAQLRCFEYDFFLGATEEAVFP